MSCSKQKKRGSRWRQQFSRERPRGRCGRFLLYTKFIVNKEVAPIREEGLVIITNSDATHVKMWVTGTIIFQLPLLEALKNKRNAFEVEELQEVREGCRFDNMSH